MKTICKIMIAMIAISMIIMPAMGMETDKFGREYENIDGDIYYYNQTVYISKASQGYDLYPDPYRAEGYFIRATAGDLGYECFENCTVIVKGGETEIIDQNKTIVNYSYFKQIKYGTSNHYDGMGWNEFTSDFEESEKLYNFTKTEAMKEYAQNMKDSMGGSDPMGIWSKIWDEI